MKRISGFKEIVRRANVRDVIPSQAGDGSILVLRDYSAWKSLMPEMSEKRPTVSMEKYWTLEFFEVGRHSPVSDVPHAFTDSASYDMKEVLEWCDARSIKPTVILWLPSMKDLLNVNTSYFGSKAFGTLGDNHELFCRKRKLTDLVVFSLAKMYGYALVLNQGEPVVLVDDPSEPYLLVGADADDAVRQVISRITLR